MNLKYDVILRANPKPHWRTSCQPESRPGRSPRPSLRPRGVRISMDWPLMAGPGSKFRVRPGPDTFHGSVSICSSERMGPRRTEAHLTQAFFDRDVNSSVERENTAEIQTASGET